MNHFFFFLYILLIPNLVYSYIENWTESPSYLSTSGAGQSTARARLALHQNPASFSPLQYGISFNTYQPFDIQEVQISHGGIYWDFNKIGWSLNWIHTHIDSLYQENTFQIQNSWNIYSQWNIGISTSYESLRISRLGKSSGFNTSFGVLWSPNSQITIGTFLKGFWSYGFLKNENTTKIYWGGHFQTLSGHIQLYLDFSHIKYHYTNKSSIWKPWKYQIGQQIRLFSFLWLYGGFQNRPYQIAIGISLFWKGWEIQHSTSFQKILGKTIHHGIYFSKKYE